MNAAHLIQSARNRAGITQRELADNAGISQQAVSAYETGKKEPSVPMLVKLIESAGLSMQVTLLHSDDPDPPSRRGSEPGEVAQLHQRLADQARINWMRGR